MDVLTNIFEAFSFFLLYEAFLERRYKSSIFPYCFGILFLIALLFLCNCFFLYQFVNNVAMVLVGIIVALLLYKGSIKNIVLISIVVNLMSISIEVLVLYLITFVFDLTVEAAVEIPEYRLMGIVLSKVFLVVAAYGIFQYKKRKSYTISQSYWLLFFVLFGISLGTIFLLFKLSYEVVSTDYNGITLLCTIGLFVAMFFSLYLYDQQAQQAHTIHLQEQAELHMKEQLKHMDELVAQQEQLRRYRHDMSNQLIALKSYLSKSVGATELQHLARVTEELELTDVVVDSGNPALDAIISAKQAVANKKGINFRYQLQIPEQLPIAPEDICVIFGNALDNAIEACERVTQEEKNIVLTLVKKNKVVFCKLVNTAPSVQSEKRWKTSKKDTLNHDYGVSQIKRTLAKYDSSPSYSWEDGQVTLRFTFFITK